MVFLILYEVVLVVIPIVVSLIAHKKKKMERFSYGFFVIFLISALVIWANLGLCANQIWGAEANHDPLNALYYIGGVISFIELIHYVSMIILHYKYEHDIKLLCKHEKLNHYIVVEAINIFFSDRGLVFNRKYDSDNKQMRRYYELLEDGSGLTKIEAAIQVAKEDYISSHATPYPY